MFPVWGFLNMAELMDLDEAKDILTQNRLGKTFPRNVLERARDAVRAEKQLGSIGKVK